MLRFEVPDKAQQHPGRGFGILGQDPLQGVMVKEIPGLEEAIRSLGDMESPALMASATEFVLEGLHLHQKLNKEVKGGRITYGK